MKISFSSLCRLATSKLRYNLSGSFDEAHLLANVVFHVNLGKRAKVGNVEVRGPEPAEANRLLHATRSLRATATGASVKPGKSYTPKRIDSAVALMKRDLANQHHLASKVHLDQSRYHRDTNHADIVIDALPGPVVSVRVVGAKLSWLPFLRGRQMKKLIPIFSEGTVDPDLVEEGRRNLIDFFQSKGYFDVKVNSSIVEVFRNPVRSRLVRRVASTRFACPLSSLTSIHGADAGKYHSRKTTSIN